MDFNTKIKKIEIFFNILVETLSESPRSKEWGITA